MRTSGAYAEATEVSDNKMFPLYLIDPVVDGGGMLIDGFDGCEVYDNGANVIAMEGTVSLEPAPGATER